MTKHNTGIEWTHIPGYTGETWNPIVGCSIASPGCKNCYAMRVANQRLDGNPKTLHYLGTTERINNNPVWTGKVARASEKTLTAPLRWKKPRAVFVNSMGDLFHPGVPDAWIDEVFAIASVCPQHIFIVLTKRPERMREYFYDAFRSYKIVCNAVTRLSENKTLDSQLVNTDTVLPLPNVWLGVSVEDQTRADERIPPLLETPAAVRIISAEPLLGGFHLGYIGWPSGVTPRKRDGYNALLGTKFIGGKGIICANIDWVIAGGESGPGARPMHPNWVRNLRDQCKAAGVPFFFKQWGEWLPFEHWYGNDGPEFEVVKGCHKQDAHDLDITSSTPIKWHDEPFENGSIASFKVGKASAGRLLDGLTHTAFPKCVEVENAK